VLAAVDRAVATARAAAAVAGAVAVGAVAVTATAAAVTAARAARAGDEAARAVRAGDEAARAARAARAGVGRGGWAGAAAEEDRAYAGGYACGGNGHETAKRTIVCVRGRACEQPAQ
jgi:hypothetical protein